MTSTQWAALLAPIFGGIIWWLLLAPGKGIKAMLERTMRPGRMRDFLLKERGR